MIDPKNSALVYEVESQHKNIFMKDIAFDDKGMPVVLASESGGWDCGPQNDPRTWLVARFDGSQWKVIPAFVSDNNYDTGSIFLKDTVWQIIAPTVPGPQAYNPGGEMMVWESINKGQTWNRVKQLTANSPRNHNYARGVLNANPDFVALWADGHGRQESDSNLYFTDAEGNVYLLSRNMNSDFENPIKVELGTIQ